MAARPKILVVALEAQWFGAARLPRALQGAGFEVGAACRSEAILTRTKFCDHFFPLPAKNHGRALWLQLQAMVTARTWDLILPLDDWAALFLAALPERMGGQSEFAALASLLQRSLGNPAGGREAASKRRTLAVAQKLGLRVPAHQTITTPAEVRAFAAQQGYPVVLKKSFSNSGHGVFVCRNESEIAPALATLGWEQHWATRFRLLRERFRGRVMERRWLPKDLSLTVNQFIPGKCAMSLAAAGAGQTLALLTAEVEKTFPEAKSPSSVLKFVRHAEIQHATQTLLRHWGLTGLIGFDFIVDAAGQAWLLECNPRPTTIGHLGAMVGTDLCGALKDWVTGEPRSAPDNFKELLVAHFPQESWRDPHSPYLTQAFHDVPLDDPDLLAYLKKILPPGIGAGSSS